MNYSYRYKTPIEKLEDHHLQFAFIYAETFDSLNAYNESHKHINKVRASTILQSPAIWDAIIEKIKKFDAKTKFQNEMIRQYDHCKSSFNLSPTEIYSTYAITCQKDAQVKKDDTSPINVIRKLAFAWKFFNFIQRDFFITKLADAIQREHNYYIFLLKGNESWRTEFTALTKELESDGIQLHKILSNGSEKG